MQFARATFASLPLLILGLLHPGPGAEAAGLEGSENLICAAIDTMHCQGSSDCIQGSAQEINIPLFFHLDTKEMVVRRDTGEGTERTSKIDDLKRENGQILLQGIEDGLGWTLLINEASGNMTLTASGNDEAFVVFGACTTP